MPAVLVKFGKNSPDQAGLRAASVHAAVLRVFIFENIFNCPEIKIECVKRLSSDAKNHIARFYE